MYMGAYYYYGVAILAIINFSVVRELFDYCSVKDTDQDGNTPLHLACIHGFVDIVELLVNHNADIEAV